MTKTSEEKREADIEGVETKITDTGKVVEDIRTAETNISQIKHFRTYVRIGILIIVGKTTPHKFSDVQFINDYIPFPEIVYALAPMDLIKMYVKMNRSLDFRKGKIKIVGGFTYKLFGSIDGDRYSRLLVKSERDLGLKFIKTCDSLKSKHHTKR